MKKLVLCLSLAFSMNLFAVESIGGGGSKGDKSKCAVSCSDGSKCTISGPGAKCECNPSASCTTSMTDNNEVDNLSDYLRAREADAR